ncbi:MAG: 16S rRNA (uracil(1498)-N(3))-methyltransferase [Ilumatobacter sp.]
MPVPSIPDRLRNSSTHVLLPVGSESFLDHDVIELDPDVEHHLTRVLRLRDGEPVSVTDGSGRWRPCRARLHGRNQLQADGDVHVQPERVRFTIASAIPKGDRVDWLVQKVTELGADRIVLMHAERSAIRWKHERATKQLVRLQRIADEAVRQSRRVWRCAVEGPVDAVDILDRAVVAEPGGRPISPADSLVAIGPEGGWSEVELRRAHDRVTVGGSILRTETAAVAATTLRMVLDH